MVFRPAWPAITPPSLYGRLLCPWRKSPQTLTHLDTYCRRVCASDISEADLGTFGRSFVCEVLASLDFSLTSAIGRVHCNLQGICQVFVNIIIYPGKVCRPCVPSWEGRSSANICSVESKWSTKQQLKADRNPSVGLSLVCDGVHLAGGLSAWGGVCLWMTLSTVYTSTPSA